MREIFSTKQENTNFNAKKLIAGAAITLSAFGLTSCKDNIVETVSSSGDSKESSVLFNADCASQDPDRDNTRKASVTMNHNKIKTQADLESALFSAVMNKLENPHYGPAVVYSEEQQTDIRESVNLATDQRYEGNISTIDQNDSVDVNIIAYGDTSSRGTVIEEFELGGGTGEILQASTERKTCVAYNDRGAVGNN
jgi:hypothetical protein